jgi:hypothetical protein
MKRIICISDWCADDLLYTEFSIAISGYAHDPKKIKIDKIVARPSTLHTGFLAQQIAYTTERLGIPSEMILFLGTDPRLANEDGVVSRQGADFIIAKLSSGLVVCGVNSDSNFSFLKRDILSVHKYQNFDGHTFSRARDVFSRAIVHLSDYMDDSLDMEEIHISSIADEPTENIVLHIDNFGNIVTNITQEKCLEDKNFGHHIRLNFAGEAHEAKIVRDRFAGEPGELVMYPGSNGRLDNPYMEISLWSIDSGHTRKKNQFFTSAMPGHIIHLT